MTRFGEGDAPLKRRPEEKSVAGRQTDGRTVVVLALTGAVVGSVAWLIYRNLSRPLRNTRDTNARDERQANARHALAMKQSRVSEQERPRSITTGAGMRSIPNTGIAPSGALNQQGRRPVLERSRKVR